jgi:DnaK suppressor protein
MTHPIDDPRWHSASAWLARREAQLVAEITQAEADGRDLDTLGADAVNDDKDDDAKFQRSGLAAAEIARDDDELAEVRAARRRLANGDYGQCGDCGQAIDARRLEAQPAALRCAACQRGYERKRLIAR